MVTKVTYNLDPIAKNNALLAIYVHVLHMHVCMFLVVHLVVHALLKLRTFIFLLSRRSKVIFKSTKHFNKKGNGTFLFGILYHNLKFYNINYWFRRFDAPYNNNSQMYGIFLTS